MVEDAILYGNVPINGMDAMEDMKEEIIKVEKIVVSSTNDRKSAQ